MDQALQEPNLYELSSDDRIVSYTTSSVAGQRLFTFAHSEGQHSFTGGEIESAETALGTEVTVTLETVPDLETIRLTLILPSIRMSQGEEVSVSTFGVLTTTSTPVAGPPPGVGQTYEVFMLDGTAKLVQS